MLCTPPGRTTELWPPLGLLYIAACSNKERDDEIEVVDAFCLNLSSKELVDRVLKFHPDVFGMNCSTHTFLQAMEVFEEIAKRLPDTKLILGGYHATFATEEILRNYPCIDFIIRGEAEGSFPLLLGHIENRTSPEDVPGIAFVHDGALTMSPIALIKDLDRLEFPQRGLIKDVEYGYYHQGIPLTFGKFTTMSTSRGCPYDCTYCSCASFSLRKWRYRSPESIVDEMCLLQSQGYKSVVIVDDNFTQRPDRVHSICDEMERRHVHLRLACEGRVNRSSPDMLRRMKEVGFDVIYFGCESASPKVLDYYNKKIGPDAIAEAVKNAKAANMIVLTSFIVGAEVEDKEDIAKTIDLIQDMRPHAVEINILDYLVGTPLWEDAQKRGIVRSNDWTTNHRVYEYGLCCLDQEELQIEVNRGYDAYLNSWKNVKGLMELANLLVHNATARKVVIGNLFNPKARQVVRAGIKPFKDKGDQFSDRP